MPAFSNFTASSIAGLLMLVTAGAATAAPAIATGSVNVRSGPGTSYAVRDTLNRGERVNVRNCAGGWCYIVRPGADGWVSSSYLADIVRRPAGPRVYISPPPRFNDHYWSPPHRSICRVEPWRCDGGPRHRDRRHNW